MQKMTTRRKLAIATWAPPREGNIFGKLTCDVTEARRYIARVREVTGERVTITHLVGRAVALALAEAPGLNGTIRFGRYVPHERVDISFLVALDEGADLGKALVRDADRKTTVDIARELRALAERLRAGQDSDFEKSKGLLRVLPTWLIRPLLWLTGWLSGSLGLSIPALGVQPYPFGSCIVTSVGMLGLDEAFAPHTPFARVPVLVLVGAIRDRPAAVDGRVVVRPEITITATIDHRFLDGFQGAVLARRVREVLEDPWTHDGAAERPAG